MKMLRLFLCLIMFIGAMAASSVLVLSILAALSIIARRCSACMWSPERFNQ